MNSTLINLLQVTLKYTNYSDNMLGFVKKRHNTLELEINTTY